MYLLKSVCAQIPQALSAAWLWNVSRQKGNLSYLARQAPDEVDVAIHDYRCAISARSAQVLRAAPLGRTRVIHLQV